MYYHIIIESKTKYKQSLRNNFYHEYDLDSRSSVISDIIKPYISDNDFYIDGHSCNKDNIVQIIIKESEETMDRTVEIYNSNKNDTKEYSRNSILRAERMLKVVTNDLIREAKEFTTKQNKENSNGKLPAHFDKTKVFIVHGHDVAAKQSVARFVEKFGLEAVILHEQTSSSMAIIEKIEKYSDVGFGIVIYTACDVGATMNDADNLKSRARQNVVFEHGFLMGKIGRNNVCAVVKGCIETPNDISGIVYVDMDEKNRWEVDIAKEMKSVGYDIDMNKLF